MAEIHRVRAKFRVRSLTSLLLGVTFLAMVFSGAMLFASPQGKVANWSGWTLAGLEKEQWAEVHTNLSVLFLIVAVVHLYLNWRAIWAYLREKTAAGMRMRWEWVAAVAIAGGVIWGTVADVPPFRWIGGWNDQIKAYWARVTPIGPMAHAEELTLDQFADRIKLTTEQVIEALRKEGFAAADTQATVAEVARSNGVAPRELYAAIRRQHPDVHISQGRGGGQGQGAGLGGGGFGWGQMTVQQLAGQIGVKADELVEALRKEGFRVESAAATMEQVANSKGIRPREVIGTVTRLYPDADLPRGGGGGGRGMGGGRGAR